MILLASIAISKLVGLLTNDRKINLKEDPTAKTGKPIDILDIPRNTTHATRNNTTTEYPPKHRIRSILLYEYANEIYLRLFYTVSGHLALL
jgi:hypothetical protein